MCKPVKNLQIPERLFIKQDAMDNFVFPYEMKTKLKMHEYMNIFHISQKKGQKVIFYFHWTNS